MIQKRNKLIPVFRPSMGKEEIDAVAKVIKSKWIGMGEKTEEFEKEFAKYINVPFAIGTNSATAALHLALRAAGIKFGDEVITTAMTFASTVEAILYNDATPIFADIEYGTMNIDPMDIEKKITPKTKAIIPVHFGGHPCNMDAIMDIAKKYKLQIIEDAAHACGGMYGGRYAGQKVGSLGNLTCFSFHAVKNLATGDGGMITTTDKNLAAKIKKMRWMGISKDTYQRSNGKYKWDYDIIEQGWKYHPNDILSAIGLEQLKKLDTMNNRRRNICSLYNTLFNAKKLNINIPAIAEDILHARHNYIIKLPEHIDREELIAFLADNNISTGVHYKPLYYHPRYSQYNKNDTPIKIGRAHV